MDALTRNPHGPALQRISDILGVTLSSSRTTAFISIRERVTVNLFGSKTYFSPEVWSERFTPDGTVVCYVKIRGELILLLAVNELCADIWVCDAGGRRNSYPSLEGEWTGDVFTYADPAYTSKNGRAHFKHNGKAWERVHAKDLDLSRHRDGEGDIPGADSIV